MNVYLKDLLSRQGDWLFFNGVDYIHFIFTLTLMTVEGMDWVLIICEFKVNYGVCQVELT